MKTNPQTLPMTTDGHEKPPELFAVIDPKSRLVVARGMSEAKAGGFAKGWRRRHGKAKVVPDPVTFPPPSVLLGEAKPAIPLPPLRCRILKDGKLNGISEQPDPRIGFCEAFNRQAGRWGYSAEPMPAGKLPPLCAGIYDAQGNLTRITEMPDPRERYCQTFGEFAIGATAIPLDGDDLEAARQLLAEREKGGAA